MVFSLKVPSEDEHGGSVSRVLRRPGELDQGSAAQMRCIRPRKPEVLDTRGLIPETPQAGPSDPCWPA